MRVGCPRNTQIFFSVLTETNCNSICFGCFLVCFAKLKTIFFGLFWCFGPVSKQPKQTEFCRNKPKKSPKNVLYWGSSKPLIFFLGSNRKKTKTHSGFGCVSVCFFRIDVSDRYQNNRNKQNLWYGELKWLIF